MFSEYSVFSSGTLSAGFLFDVSVYGWKVTEFSRKRGCSDWVYFDPNLVLFSRGRTKTISEFFKQRYQKTDDLWVVGVQGLENKHAEYVTLVEGN